MTTGDSQEVERLLIDRLNAIGPEARAILLHILKLPDLERVRSIGEFYGDPRTRSFAQILVDLEESPEARALALRELEEPEPRGEH